MKMLLILLTLALPACVQFAIPLSETKELRLKVRVTGEIYERDRLKLPGEPGEIDPYSVFTK